MTEWELVDDFGVLTINNPPQNFLTEPEFVRLSDLQRWISNESLKGLIIIGKGRHFSAGADKNNILTAPDEEGIKDNLTKGKKVLDFLWNLPIPTIAAIKGVCFGGGLEVALSSHIRISSDKSLFSFPESGLGIMPGLHGTVKLPGLIGMANAIDMLLTGKTINAQEALRLKLIDFVVPAKEVYEFSLDFLRRLTSNKPVNVIHAVVQSFINARKLSEDEAKEKLNRIFCELVDDVAKKQ